MTIGAPTTLFKFAGILQVAGLSIPLGAGTGLDVAFHVQRGTHVLKATAKPRVNTCTVKIINLSPDHRKMIEQSTVPGSGASGPNSVVPVVISAGYAGRQSQIFAGEMRAAYSIHQGPDVVTELTTGDGDHAIVQTRLNLCLGAGSSGADALRAIVSALGVGQGNLPKALALLNSQPLAAQMASKGLALHGYASDIMTDFCRSVGLEWSVQNGALQFTQVDQPLDGEAVLIDEDHGMLGSPTVDTRGLLSVTTMMIPGIVPGVKLSLNSDFFKGGYRVIGVETKGDTFSNEWVHKIEAVRY